MLSKESSILPAIGAKKISGANPITEIRPTKKPVWAIGILVSLNNVKYTPLKPKTTRAELQSATNIILKLWELSVPKPIKKKFTDIKRKQKISTMDGRNLLDKKPARIAPITLR